MPGTLSEVLPVELASERLELLGERAVWWPDRRVLLIADAHLGKAGHFRKAGIPVPRAVGEAGLRRIEALCHAYRPEELFFLGDLFQGLAALQGGDQLIGGHAQLLSCHLKSCQG